MSNELYVYLYSTKLHYKLHIFIIFVSFPTHAWMFQHTMCNKLNSTSKSFGETSECGFEIKFIIQSNVDTDTTIYTYNSQLNCLFSCLGWCGSLSEVSEHVVFSLVMISDGMGHHLCMYTCNTMSGDEVVQAVATERFHLCSDGRGR